MFDMSNASMFVAKEGGMTVLHVKQMLIFNLICWIEKQLLWGQSTIREILFSSD